MRWMFVVAVLISCSNASSKRRYARVVALDDGTAVVAWEEAEHVYGVSRLDSSGRQLWATKLEGRPVTLSDGTFVTKDQIVVRTHRWSKGVTTAAIEAIESATGRHVWTTPLRTLASTDDDEDPFKGFVSDRALRVFLRSRGSSPTELVDLDPVSGRELGRKALPISFSLGAAPLVLGNDLVVHHGDQVVVASASDVTISEARGYGCVIDGEYWRLVRSSTALTLAPLRERGLAPIPMAAAADADAYLQGCGGYRGSFALFLSREVRIVDGEGTTVKRIELGDHRLGVNASPQTLTRFTPVVASNGTDHAVVVIDLEEGRIAWQVAAPDVPTLFRVDGRWYWTWWEEPAGQTIVALDGAAGTAKAIHVGGAAAATFGRNNVAGRSLWLMPPANASRADAVPIARLDSDTLQVVTKTIDLDIEDVPLDRLTRARNL